MTFAEPSGKRAPWLAGLILSASVLGVFGHEGHAPLPTKGLRVEGERLVLSQEAAQALGVKTAKVELRGLERIVRAHASIATPVGHLAYATTLVGGKIVEMLARPGDQVDRGQLLARMQSAEFESLQLDMLQAADELSLAERMLREREKIGGAVAGRLLLETRATRDQKAAQLTIARQKLASLGLTPELLAAMESDHEPNTTLPISSPMRGTIAEADVRTGQVVTPTEHLYHIIDQSQVWVVGEIVESQSADLKNEQRVRCMLEAFPGRVFSGSLKHVGVRLGNERRTLAVTAHRSREVRALARELAPVCPAEAAYRLGNDEYALVEDGPAKYARRKIKASFRSAKYIAIASGLFPGDRVVTIGRQELAAAFGPPPRLKSKPAFATRPANRSTGDIIEATGRVVLPTDAKSYASTSAEGRVVAIKVAPGQHVAKGQILAEVESLALENLQLDWLLAMTFETWTRQSLRALEPLAASQAVPERELWQMRNKHHAYQHQVTSLAHRLKFMGVAEEELERLRRLDLSATTEPLPTHAPLPLRSPAGGLIADSHINIGQVVNTDDRLFEIQNVDRIWIQADLFERDAALVFAGQAATVAIAAQPEFIARGVVTRIGPQLSAASHVLQIWVELDNAGPRLKEGMSARVQLQVDPQGKPTGPTAKEQHQHVE